MNRKHPDLAGLADEPARGPRRVPGGVARLRCTLPEGPHHDVSLHSEPHPAPLQGDPVCEALPRPRA